MAVELLTLAVTVFFASRVPLSLSARTSNVCEPLLTELDVQNPSVSPNGGLISESTFAPSTTNSIEPGSSSTLSPFLSYTARQFTTPDNVDPPAIDCVTAPVELGGSVVLLLTLAVTVFFASRVPLSLSARTSNVCEPLLTELDVQNPSVSPNGGLISESTFAPSTTNSIEPDRPRPCRRSCRTPRASSRHPTTSTHPRSTASPRPSTRRQCRCAG